LIMPDSSEPLFWSVHCPLSRIGHLKGFLTRVPATMMDLNEPGGKIRSFRVMVPQLGSASLGNYLPSSLAEFAEIFSEPKRRSFSVAKVEFRSLGTSPYKQECDVTFFRALP
jgi:hypothetical protein